MRSSTRFLSEKLSMAVAINFNGESKQVEAEEEEKTPAEFAQNSSFNADYKLREAQEWNAKVVNITRILVDHDIVMNTSFINEIRQDLNSANDYFDIIKKMAANNLLNQRNFGKLLGLGDLLGTSAYYVKEFAANKLLTQSRFHLRSDGLRDASSQ
jgi:type I restriction-modification system DNA methylase subunit